MPSADRDTAKQSSSDGDRQVREVDAMRAGSRWLPPAWSQCPQRGRTHGFKPSSAPVTAGKHNKAVRCVSAVIYVRYLMAPGTLQGEREAGWGRRDLASLTQLMFAKHWWKWAGTVNDKSGAWNAQQADAGSTSHTIPCNSHHWSRSFPPYLHSI